MSKKFSAAGLDRDHGLSRFGYRIGDVGQHEVVRLAILRAENGFHGRT
jgi:hypothetical protein